MIEERTIIKELKAYVGKFDTSKLAAASLKVTPAQLSTTLNGKANVIPEKILKKLGYKSKLVYLPLKAAKNVPAEAAPAALPVTTPDDIVAHQARTKPPVTLDGIMDAAPEPVEEVINVRDGG